MLFWVREYAYSYSEKREYLLKDFLIATPFVGTLKNYELLKKSYLAPRQLHRLPYTIDTTLFLFEMMKHLSEDI
ncbi:TPA: hypothetical protein DCZ39_07740 [Patescibacteria group bacterium]|nr:hypothetical protein [Candidatus Gracilibacteria bacterium]